MSGVFEPWFIMPGGPLAFPDPRAADGDGLVAFGGDLSVARLLLAYRSGIFPWYDQGLPPMWWSPDPRCSMTPERLHLSRRLLRTIRAARFTLGWDRAFDEVIDGCAEGRPEGTWILPEMREAYCELHRLGHAHSLGVWQDGELVGGLYGVQVGGLFAAESMFHRRSDMSKIALVAALRSTFAAGIRVFDVQFETPHLGRLGAFGISRARYLETIAAVVDLPVDLRGLEPDFGAARS